MILMDVNNYLREHRRASLTDMALSFKTTPDALRDMLSVLERKGKVRRLPAGTTCSGCNKCSAESIELYECCG